MKELSQILGDATAAIDLGYFRLRIDRGDPVYRERVYCYELYHQMRLRWPADCPFYLNGELDKAAHPILKELGADFAKPDLLIHQPGYMIGNHAIIEVKTCEATRGDIGKDVLKLSLFLSKVGYQRAIYLIYGDGPIDRTADRINEVVATLGEVPPIELWTHTTPGEPARKICTLRATDEKVFKQAGRLAL